MEKIARTTRVFVIFLLTNICVLSANTLPFDSPFNARTESKIREIAVIGERCSGTKFIQGLLKENFPQLQVTARKYAHKHFYPWLDLADFGYPHLGEPAPFPSLSRSNNCLFVMIVRNPIDWIKSFYANPYHVDAKLKNQGRLHFMSHTWEAENHPSMDDWNPYAGRPFKNVLELRKFKILNDLKIGRIVNNFIVIQYESLIKSPQHFIESLASAFNLHHPAFVNFGASNKKGAYPAFSSEEKEYLRKELDWETEALVGYTPN